MSVLSDKEQRKLLRLQVAAPIYAELLRQHELQFDIFSGDDIGALATRRRIAARIAKGALAHAELLMEMNDERA